MRRLTPAVRLAAFKSRIAPGPTVTSLEEVISLLDKFNRAPDVLKLRLLTVSAPVVLSTTTPAEISIASVEPGTMPVLQVDPVAKSPLLTAKIVGAMTEMDAVAVDVPPLPSEIRY